MSWEATEVRKVKMTIKRSTPKGQDLTVTFGVEGAKKADFLKAMTDYVSFVESQDGMITNVEEIIDAESGEVCSIYVSLVGTYQEILVQEFQKRAASFIGASQWQY